MIRLAVFGSLQALVLAYAFSRGRGPERFAALATSGALLAGWLLPFNEATAYQAVEVGQLTIDVSLFVALLVLAIKADRYWPIWLAAVQLVALGFHGVRAYDPDILPVIYNRLVGWLGYPMLILMTIGIWRDRKRQIEAERGTGTDSGAPGWR